MEELRARTTLFCGVLAFAIALSVLLRGRRTVHWLFAAFALDLAFWYTSQSLAGLSQSPIWGRATAVLTVLLPQFAVHLFSTILPSESDKPSRLKRFAAIAALPMLALELSPYHEAAFSLGLVYCYVFGLLVAALFSLARNGLRSASRAERDRVRFLVGVGALATSFTLADFLSFLGRLYLPPIGAVLSIVFLFVLAESLTRPRLADLYEMAGRLLVSTALAFCLAGIFYVFVTYIGRFRTMYLNAVLAALVFMVLFEPLQNEVETRIHQFFFRERYDLETSVSELRRRLSHVLEIEEMVETLLTGLEGSRRITSGAIYLRDQDGNGFDLVRAIGEDVPKRIESLAARPLLDVLRQKHSLSLEEMVRENRDPQRTLVTAATSIALRANAILLSVRGDDGDIVGLIAVADDRVRDAFTPEEVVLLETIAGQIGVAIANSRVYTRMKERDRLAALGAMAAGLAHEVKNPLGAIKGAAQLLEELDGSAAGKDPTMQEFIGIILEEVNRLDHVVGSFLDYARPHAGNPIPLDINAAVRRTVQILASQQSDMVDVHLDLVEPLPRAKIDPEQFRQVLINLVQNAMQAMDGGGKVTIATSHRRVTRAGWSQTSPQSDRGPVSRPDDSEFIEVAVRDTGPGIPQKVLRNLFIPFFTTKEQGTGLGLAISQSIVQNAGGTIDVQSHSGKGTTFTVVLPIATEALGVSTPPAPKAAIA